MVDNDKSLYSLTEAANLLQCHVETLRRAIRKGTLKAARVGREYKISKEDLENYYADLGGGSLGKIKNINNEMYNWHKLFGEADDHLTFLRDMIAGFKVSIGFGGGLSWRDGIGIKELDRMEKEADQALNKLSEGCAKLSWYEHDKKNKKKRRQAESDEQQIPKLSDNAMEFFNKLGLIRSDPEKSKALDNFIEEQLEIIKNK